MGLFTITSFCAFAGIVMSITGLCHDLPRTALIGLLMMAPEAGNEVGLWTIPILCTEVQVQGCIK
jgi:hypothetical protein